ncbi:MAG TPA: hypothetical protein PLC27_09020 [Saprospiraceae bacterium]|nr:hypothetical protein [Saprospiraceae bacterium]HRG41532.1 hypothetical protein [Saprospiraceae bacterium]
MYKLWLMTICCLSIWSCKHQHGQSESPLYKDVMAIHDKVMPEMSKIHSLKKQLKAIEVPQANEIILDHVKELNDADEAMMTWMADFKVPEDQAQHDEYLKAEKVKIQQVSDQMYGAMDKASKLIDSLTTLTKK